MFASVRQGTYVDKTGMIEVINSVIGTQQKLTCITRPRRFGKSYAAKMLCAYYDKTFDSDELFRDLAMVIELKRNTTPDSALQQIEDPNYPKVLKDYGGTILAVGIVYDAKTKKHSCRIRRVQ